jgi:hypothetical protein
MVENKKYNNALLESDNYDYRENYVKKLKLRLNADSIFLFNFIK